MNQLIPNIVVKNINDTVNFFIDNFNFKLKVAVDDNKVPTFSKLDDNKAYIWASIFNENIELMFQEIISFNEDTNSNFENISFSGSFYIKVNNVDKLYDQIKSNIEIVKPIENSWYGAREFYIKDPDGYLYCFSSEVKK